jgi:TolB-like protein/class 3 adenylate cyclase/Flp pilus assembly protein TadD
MHSASSSDVKLEIGHVLFIDIVGYSKLLINEQSEQMQKLREIVRGTEQFRLAEAEGKLLRLPTGDGGALVFRTSPEAPVLCALEISKELKKHPELRVRMGIHSGPVNEITDLNEQANIAGAGINVAQRVMDCGDSGHILLSKHVADDLEQYRQWQPCLHDLGECEVKHGVHVHVFNLYADGVGNPEVPEKLLQAKAKDQAVPVAAAASAKPAGRSGAWIAALVIVAAAIAAAGFYIFSHRSGSKTILEKSIAVLPFENLSRDPDNAFFADGVQDEILTDLAKVADLKVISRTSVMQYRDKAARNLREIAQQLGVAHVLEGSVQRAASKIRINAQLIDARNDAHLWAQTYDRDLADVFAIQSEIAKTITEQLQAKLSPKEEAVIEAKPTKDMAAYDLYLKASEIDRSRASSIGTGGAEVSKQEVQLLEQAVSRDPMFVPALCKLANTYLYLYWLNDRSAPYVELAKKALDSAARLQPDAGEVHFTRGLLHYRASLDYEPALAEFALAQRSLPNDASIPFLIGMVERRQGHWDESIRRIEPAVRLDPHNVTFISEQATTYFILRRYNEAAKTLDSALAWKPLDFGMAFLRALVDKDWKADLGRLKEVVAGQAGPPAAPNDLISARLILALLERNYHAAQEALDTPGLAEFDDNGFFSPREWTQGIIARGLGDNARGNAAFLAARERAATAAQQSPDDARALIVLGQIDAALGRTADAIREGEHAVELLPTSRDALNGGLIMQKLARIYAQAGDVNRAVNFLEKIIPSPNGLSYGVLKLEQDWDALRGDPRFEKIVASLAPKQ